MYRSRYRYGIAIMLGEVSFALGLPSGPLVPILTSTYLPTFAHSLPPSRQHRELTDLCVQ